MKDVTLIIGRPRSGKTYYIEQILKTEKGRRIVYNYGMPSDFAGASNVNMLNTSGDLFFQLQAKDKKIIASSAQFLKAARYCRILKNTKAEDKLFQKVLFFYSGSFVVDDAGALTRHGMSMALTDLAGRVNHTGMMNTGTTERGTNMYFIYHNLQQVPTGFWRYATKVVLFKSSGFDGIKTANAYLDRVGREATNYLEKCVLEKRTHCIIDLVTQNTQWINR